MKIKNKIEIRIFNKKNIVEINNKNKDNCLNIYFNDVKSNLEPLYFYHFLFVIFSI
jgi:hypothetical protein